MDSVLVSATARPARCRDSAARPVPYCCESATRTIATMPAFTASGQASMTTARWDPRPREVLKPVPLTRPVPVAAVVAPDGPR